MRYDFKSLFYLMVVCFITSIAFDIYTFKAFDFLDIMSAIFGAWPAALLGNIIFNIMNVFEFLEEKYPRTKEEKEVKIK